MVYYNYYDCIRVLRLVEMTLAEEIRRSYQNYKIAKENGKTIQDSDLQTKP